MLTPFSAEEDLLNLAEEDVVGLFQTYKDGGQAALETSEMAYPWIVRSNLSQGGPVDGRLTNEVKSALKPLREEHGSSKLSSFLSIAEDDAEPCTKRITDGPSSGRDIAQSNAACDVSAPLKVGEMYLPYSLKSCGSTSLDPPTPRQAGDDGFQKQVCPVETPGIRSSLAGSKLGRRTPLKLAAPIPAFISAPFCQTPCNKSSAGPPLWPETGAPKRKRSIELQPDALAAPPVSQGQTAATVEQVQADAAKFKKLRLALGKSLCEGVGTLASGVGMAQRVLALMDAGLLSPPSDSSAASEIISGENPFEPPNLIHTFLQPPQINAAAESKFSSSVSDWSQMGRPCGAPIFLSRDSSCAVLNRDRSANLDLSTGELSFGSRFPAAKLPRTASVNQTAGSMDMIKKSLLLFSSRSGQGVNLAPGLDSSTVADDRLGGPSQSKGFVSGKDQPLDGFLRSLTGRSATNHMSPAKRQRVELRPIYASIMQHPTGPWLTSPPVEPTAASAPSIRPGKGSLSPQKLAGLPLNAEHVLQALNETLASSEPTSAEPSSDEDERHTQRKRWGGSSPSLWRFVKDIRKPQCETSFFESHRKIA